MFPNVPTINSFFFLGVEYSYHHSLTEKGHSKTNKNNLFDGTVTKTKYINGFRYF